VNSKGGVIKLKLANDVRIGRVTSAAISDVKVGTVLGVNGDQLYILSSGRGNPWTVVAVKGNVIYVSYRDGNRLAKQTITVTNKTMIFKIERATKLDLKPGSKIFSDLYQKLNDGTFEVYSISVGANGIVPSMSP
jgi:hypothetical protein